MRKSKLIMPKGDGQLKPCVKSLKIYSEKNDWLDNKEFKIKIAEELGLDINSDGPFLIKKSEIARYFGLIEYDFANKKGRITSRGKKFLKASNDENHKETIELIMESVLNDSFGRNNYAVKNSDSDIDPPKLFLRAAYDLLDLNNNEIASLLLNMHDKGMTYKDSLNYIFDYRNKKMEINIPVGLKNKYSDLKFKVFFEKVGIINKKNNIYNLSDEIYEYFSEDILKLSIYNTENATNIGMEYIDDNSIEEEIIKKVPAYDDEQLRQKNNRTPVLDSRSVKNYRYSTDYRISKTSLHIAENKCELDPTHVTFKTKYQIDYVEAHHLIPMKEQKNYPDNNLDRTENIISLCPTCHKGIHYGDDEYKSDKLKRLFDIRKEKIEHIGLDVTYNLLLKMYNVKS